MPEKREQIFEVKPARSGLERFISAVSMHGASPEVISKLSSPGMTTGERMGYLSGSGDPLGEAVVSLRYLDHEPVRPELIKALNMWGWSRLFGHRQKLKISADEHRRLVTTAIREHCDWDRMGRDERMRQAGIGRTRWNAVKPHYTDLVTRMINGEQVAINHLRRMR